MQRISVKKVRLIFAVHSFVNFLTDRLDACKTLPKYIDFDIQFNSAIFIRF